MGLPWDSHSFESSGLLATVLLPARTDSWSPQLGESHLMEAVVSLVRIAMAALFFTGAKSLTVGISASPLRTYTQAVVTSGTLALI